MAAGGSVVAVQYDQGIIMAADTLLSYGSMAKQPNIPRIAILGSHTAFSCTGDYADFQAALRDIDTELEKKKMLEDDIEDSSRMIFSYLHRSLYSKRCDFEPWQCAFVVAGYDEKGPFLGGADSIGTKWTGECISTGYGGHQSLPLLRKRISEKREATKNPKAQLTYDEAMAVVEDCMKVLFYRECRAINRFQFANITKDKVTISEPRVLDTEWEFEGFRFEKTAIIQ